MKDILNLPLEIPYSWGHLMAYTEISIFKTILADLSLMAVLIDGIIMYVMI